jgi:hypothetical protein
VVRIFMTRTFAKFARKERISNQALIDAIRAAEIRPDADLGGGIIKQRIARMNQGKSGGYRTLVIYKVGELAVFVFGFAKSKRDNISHEDLVWLQKLAPPYLELGSDQISMLVALGEWIEVTTDEE